MRVGLITQLLWPRYGDFWTKLLVGAGLEPVYAQDDAVRRALTDPRLGSVPGTAFRLAAAQALALDADVIVAPELNPGESATRGGGQDAFIADFPGALVATLGGLPPVLGVPASLVGRRARVSSRQYALKPHARPGAGAARLGASPQRGESAPPPRTPLAGATVRRRHGRRHRSAVAPHRRGGAARYGRASLCVATSARASAPP